MNAPINNYYKIICNAACMIVHVCFIHCMFLDSPPAAPSSLEQVSSANTLTSATFTWQEPTDTGGIGIDIVHYTVNTSVGSPVNTSTLSHTLTGLEVETDYTVTTARGF